MRVLHVVVGLDPALGGPPAVALRLSAAQARLGYHVRLTAHDAPQRHAEIDSSITSVPGVDAVEIIRLPPEVRYGWVVSTSAKEQLSRMITDCDVVHLHGLWEPLVRTAAGMAWNAKRPYVFTPHGMLDPWSLKQRWLKKRLAMALVFRRLLQHASALHLLNKDEADLLGPLRLSARRCVIPNGIFPEELTPLPERGAFRSKHTDLGTDPYVLFLSRLHFKKGLDYLADAFALVASDYPRLRLVVAGPDDGMRNEFEKRIAVHQLSGRVHVIGPLWGREKYEAMIDAACFCLPSRQEGFSMAITEAMACKLPVVISSHCHFPEVAEHHAGVVTELNAQAVAEGLRRVLQDEQAARAMGEAGRALVLERFTWPAIARRSLNLYAAILGTGEWPA